MQVFSPTLHRKVWTHPYGPYQAEPGTYQRFARATGINDLSPHSQDMFAAWDLRQHPEALQKILSGDARGGMNALKGEWESFAVNPRGKTDQLAGLFNQLSIGGVPVSFSNPVPVVAASDLRGGTGMFITPPAGDTLNPSQASAVAGFYQKKYTQTLKDTVPILIDVNAQQDGVAQTTGETVTQVSSFGQALQRVPFALNETTDGFLVLTKSASELRGMADKGALGIERIAGLLGELSGLAPSGGQVGKKRGFLSKALGFAAPFLSFVPGVGGLLSTLAGIGSRAAGGDYGGALTGIAGGLQSGGAFRRDPSPTTQTNPFQGVPILGNFGHNPAVQTFLHPPEKRATGGPIRKGRAYVVGDGGRPEVFEAEEDGWIHPSLSDFAGRRGSRAHGGVGSMVEGVLERVEAQLARHADAVEALHTKIGSMPAHEVVTVGSNHQSAQRAIAEAWKARAARDPKVVEWMQRRNVGL
jgi:hypothetical protein